MIPYQPNSLDAQLGRILERLDGQDNVLRSIAKQVEMTNGRVKALEKWRYFVGGAICTITCLIGWYVTWAPKR